MRFDATVSASADAALWVHANMLSARCWAVGGAACCATFVPFVLLILMVPGQIADRGLVVFILACLG
jgi:hypothetical protein